MKRPQKPMGAFPSRREASGFNEDCIQPVHKWTQDKPSLPTVVQSWDQATASTLSVLASSWNLGAPNPKPHNWQLLRELTSSVGQNRELGALQENNQGQSNKDSHLDKQLRTQKEAKLSTEKNELQRENKRWSVKPRKKKVILHGN